MTLADKPTVLIVPGLRDHVSEHRQALLAARLPQVRTVPPMGRENLDCATRVQAIEREIAAVQGPVVIVAHSGGCVMAAHWAQVTRHAASVRGALLATPPDFDRPMPAGYPSLGMLQAGGWLPVRAPACPSAAWSPPATTTPWAPTAAWSSWPRPGAATPLTSAKWGTSTPPPGLANGQWPTP